MPNSFSPHIDNSTAVRVSKTFSPVLSKTIFFSAKDNRPYLITASGQKVYFTDHSFFSRFEILNDSLIACMKYKTKGVGIYNIRTKKQVANLLTTSFVNTLMEDREENIWIATENNGVYKVNIGYQQYSFSDPETLRSIVSIIKRSDDIYLVTARDTKYWKLDRTDNYEFWFKTPHLCSAYNVYSNEGKGTFLHYTHAFIKDLLYPNPDDKLRMNVKTVHYYNSDTLLVSSGYGAFLLGFPKLNVIKKLFPGRTTCAYYQNGVYYLGTLNGLYTVNAADLKANNLGTKYPQLSGRISSFAEGKNGMLWIATYDNGVVGYKDRNVITSITKKSHFITSDLCRSIYASEDALWIGTEKGLNRIDLGQNSFPLTDRYTQADGLNSDIVNAVFAEKDTVFVGTPEGLTCFSRSAVKKTDFCNLKMTGVYVSGKKISDTISSLVLSNDKNNIRFEFSGISFSSAGNMLYKYRLSDLDQNWRSTTDQLLNYPSLPSGSYVLELIAINKFGTKSNVLRYPFIVKHKFYETAWFRLVMLTFLSVFTYFFIRFRVRYLQRKEREKHLLQQKAVELEQMALRAQMNPHFIFNSLNSLQRYIIKQDTKAANYYLSRFAGLVRQTLENSSKMYLPLEEEVAYLDNYVRLEQLQMKDQFDYEISVHPSLNQSGIMVPNMVIQPYIENAIKHGMGIHSTQKGKIYIAFKPVGNNCLECIVEDNGPGINHSIKQREGLLTTHESKGMSITERRVATLNQLSTKEKEIEIKIQDLGEAGGQVGTRITISIPF